MKTVSIDELDKQSFNVIFINALRQFWRNTKNFQCINNPKKYNLLLYLDGCRIEYTDKNGKTTVAKSGDVVYTPVGSEYYAVLSDFILESSHTVGINFLLTDEIGESIVLSKSIEVFKPDSISDISALFDRAAINDQGSTSISLRVILLDILSQLIITPSARKNDIVPFAVNYLSKHLDENTSITELAAICKVSEVYLRRKFKESIGLSPAKYRNNLRLHRAVSYLKFGDISVQEISDTLGYSTVSHFIKEFRIHFGISPLQYKKKLQDEI